MLSISSGQLKGMKVQTLEGEDKTRPTSMKVRQAVLNMVQMEIQDVNAVDLFAGSGAVGLEFLSRGAKQVHFVEKERQAFLTLKTNCEAAQTRLRIEKNTQILVNYMKVSEFLQKNADVKFDLIWADPPYHIAVQELTNWANRLPQVLAPQGLFLLECDAKSKNDVLSLFSSFPEMKLEKDKEYGLTAILGWRLEA